METPNREAPSLLNLLQDVQYAILSYTPYEMAKVFPCVSKAFSELARRNDYWDALAVKNKIKHLTLDCPYNEQNARESYINRCNEVYRMIICIYKGNWNVKNYDIIECFNPIDVEALKAQLPVGDMPLKHLLFLMDTRNQDCDTNQYANDPVAMYHILTRWVKRLTAAQKQNDPNFFHDCHQTASALTNLHFLQQAMQTLGLEGLEIPPTEEKEFFKLEEMYFASIRNVSLQFYFDYCEKDSVQAIKMLKRAVAYGDPKAYNQLALAYHQGLYGIPNDKEKAFNLFEQAANLGHTYGNLNLAMYYKYGYGTPVDHQKAIEHYEFAARQNCADAQLELGKYFDKGSHVPQDYLKAVEFYELAIKQNKAKGQFLLGKCYFEGKGVLQDYKKASELFQLAADQNDADGQAHLGKCYFEGKGVSKDSVQAAKLFRLAANQGNSEGNYGLGRCLFEGKGVALDYKSARLNFSSAAENGHPEAARYLGICYRDGKGTNRHPEYAVKLFRALAGANGGENAKAELGICYLQGVGVDRNVSVALELLEEAATRGSAFAQNQLGNLYFEGKVVPRDYSLAAILFQDSAAQGDVLSKCSLSRCYLNGLGVEQNLNKGEALLKEVADEGSAEAQVELGIRHVSQNKVVEAIKYFQLAADQNYADGQVHLGKCYFEGTGVSQSYKEAFKLFKLAADQKSVEGKFYLGKCYFEGKGVSQNYKEAFDCFHFAQYRNVEAGYLLGRCYFEGKGTIQDDYKAFGFFSVAAEKGHIEAIYYKGLCYRDGRGTSEYAKLAIDLFQIAADKGLCDAKAELGMCYLTGFGVPRNDLAALDLLHDAASNGSAKAEHMLADLNFEGKIVERNLSKAANFYEQLCLKGVLPAIYRLSLCYLNAEGSGKDLKKGLYLLQKAADKGLAEAQYELSLYSFGKSGYMNDINKAVHYCQLAVDKNHAGAKLQLTLLKDQLSYSKMQKFQEASVATAIFAPQIIFLSEHTLRQAAATCKSWRVGISAACKNCILAHCQHMIHEHFYDTQEAEQLRLKNSASEQCSLHNFTPLAIKRSIDRIVHIIVISALEMGLAKQSRNIISLIQSEAVHEDALTKYFKWWIASSHEESPFLSNSSISLIMQRCLLIDEAAIMHKISVVETALERFQSDFEEDEDPYDGQILKDDRFVEDDFIFDDFEEAEDPYQRQILKDDQFGEDDNFFYDEFEYDEFEHDEFEHDDKPIRKDPLLIEDDNYIYKDFENVTLKKAANLNHSKAHQGSYEVQEIVQTFEKVNGFPYESTFIGVLIDLMMCSGLPKHSVDLQQEYKMLMNLSIDIKKYDEYMDVILEMHNSEIKNTAIKIFLYKLIDARLIYYALKCANHINDELDRKTAFHKVIALLPHMQDVENRELIISIVNSENIAWSRFKNLKHLLGLETPKHG